MCGAVSHFNFFTIYVFYAQGHFLILAFANKYNQLIIHIFYFLSFIVTGETNKEKKKKRSVQDSNPKPFVLNPSTLPTELQS